MRGLVVDVALQIAQRLAHRVGLLRLVTVRVWASVRVRVRVRVSARVGVRVSVRVPVRASVQVRVRASVRVGIRATAPPPRSRRSGRGDN